MKSNFQKVTEFNRVMGLADNEPFGFPPLKQMELRRALIHEECIVELDEANEERDLVKAMDVCGDGLVVVYGLANDYGFDADVVFDIIHRSNMSKTCKTTDEARTSVSMYKTGTHPDKHGTVIDSVSYKKVGDVWVVYNTETGKGLKSYRYKSPEEELKAYAKSLLDEQAK